MTNLSEIDTIIDMKFEAWKRVESVWDKFFDLDVEIKNFMDLFRGVFVFREFYEKLEKLHEQKHRTHYSLMQILGETRYYLANYGTTVV